MPRSTPPGQANTPAQLQAALTALFAARGRRRTYARWALPLPRGDAWQLAAGGAAGGLGAPDVAWHDPVGEVCFVGWGRAATVAGAQSTAGAARARRLLAQLAPATAMSAGVWDRLPALVGTLPFFSCPPAGSEGSRPGAPPWPRARPLVLPKVLCCSVGAHRWLVFSASLPADAAGRRTLARRWWRQATLLGTVARGTKAGPAPSAAGKGRDEASDGQAKSGVALEDEAAYRARVCAVLREVAAKEVTKVVLARALRLEAPAGHAFVPWASARRLRHQQPAAKVFCVAYGRNTSFVGASPELLASMRDRQVHSCALAGTLPRGATPTEDAARRRALSASTKDGAEQAAVVAGLLAALKPHLTRTQVEAAPRAVATAQLWHLRTDVVGRARPGRDLLHLVAALHPTPAVGGTPVAAALHRLRRQEPWRGDYAGPVGWLSVAGGCFAVALRSALLRPTRAWAFAGAGIVRGSVPASEWRETTAKLTTVLGGLVHRPQAALGGGKKPGDGRA